MKIKVKDITKAFSKRQLPTGVFEKSPMDKMVDSLNDYKRKLQIYPAYKELREVYEMFGEDQKALVKRLIKEHCSTTNEDPEGMLELPDEKHPEYNRELEKMLDAEYTLKRTLKFSQKELEGSRLALSDWEKIEPFLTLKDSPKP